MYEGGPKDSDQVVKIVLFDTDGKILVLKNENWGPDLPGGHIMVGEDLRDGLKREVEEETGLQLKDFSKIDYENKNKTFYYGTVPSKKIVLSLEHDGYDFLTLEEVLESDMKESFKKAAKMAAGR